MSKIQTQPAQIRPMVVLDFNCDHCGKKIDAVVVATGGTQKRIFKSYHEKCWAEHILPKQGPLRRTGVN